MIFAGQENNNPQNTSEIKFGMKVRFENQKWKGVVLGIREEEVQVHFEGKDSNEFVDPMFLRPF